ARPGVAALNLDGTVNPGFVPPPRYNGRMEGQTAKHNENPTTDVTGLVESLLVTRNGRFLMVGGTFIHFGYDHAADPDHTHAGLIALDPTTGALAAWQPQQSSTTSSKRRPAFGLANYNGNPRDVGINADEVFFAATGGAGGRVIAWAAGGSKDTPLWRGGVDGDALAVAVTHDRVYLVGHFDHAVPDPNDPCLDYGPLPGGGNGVLCDKETPRRHLVAWDVRGEIVNGKNTGKAILDPSFTAQANTSEGPYTIHLGANRMYVGGNFTEVASTPVATGGQSVKQPGFAAYPPL
ncbi:MAG: hypothetical protein ACRDYF_11850, partial [Acidimicrobiia bacterium]